ncbi:unnamed protein product [Periconia digitata]|uniref:Uncharacterized protein n=1 Tax=Periconia digitata TaxID=1303443 RepID=A0A9W4UQ95_9PLEO|nr:unnamed protein product [Periconia digitata]
MVTVAVAGRGSSGLPSRRGAGVGRWPAPQEVSGRRMSCSTIFIYPIACIYPCAPSFVAYIHSHGRQAGVVDVGWLVDVDKCLHPTTTTTTTIYMSMADYRKILLMRLTWTSFLSIHPHFWPHPVPVNHHRLSH